MSSQTMGNINNQTFIDSLYAVEYSQFNSTDIIQIEEANNIEMDLNIILFSNNHYTENFAGFKYGLIELRNLQRVYFQNETFIHNGENTFETSTYCTLYNGT